MNKKHIRQIHNEIRRFFYSNKDKAKALLKEALAATETKDPAFHLLFQAVEQYFLHNYQHQLALVDKSLALRQEESCLHWERGIAMAQLKDYKEALAAYDKAIELDPNYASPWNGKGNALSYLKDYKEAIAAYDKAIELDPNYASPWNGKGNALSDLNNYKESLAAYDKAIELDPNDALPWNGKGNALRNLKEYKEAIAAYNKAIELHPNDAIPWNGKGNALSKLKKYKEAIAAYNKAIELHPNDAIPWNGKGNALSDLKDYKEAIAAYDKAIELDPNYASPWNGKGATLGNLKEYKEALAAFDKAIELDPNDALPWNGKGNTLKKLKEYEEALAAFDKAIKLDPNDALPWNGKGNALSELKDYKEAIAAYDKAIELDPNYALPWNGKGATLSDLKDYKEAIAAYDKAIELDPIYALPWNGKGNALSELKDYKEAIAAYDKAIELDPNYAYPWMNKALLFVEQEENEAARDSAEKALALDLADSWLNSAFQYIRGKVGKGGRNKQLAAKEGKGQQPLAAAKKDATENSPPSFVLGVISRIREEMHKEADAFLQEMEKNKERLNSFVNSAKRGNEKGAWFHVLRKYNSYTPILPVDGTDRSIGGGYFLQSFGTGIVIDPGFGFIENFYKAGFSLDDIDVIVITHAHNDHNSDFESLLTLCHICNKERTDTAKASRTFAVQTQAKGSAPSPGAVTEHKGKKQVDVYLNSGAFIKFSGMLNLRDAPYLNNVYTLMRGHDYNLNDRTSLKALPAYHDEVITKKYAVGLLFTITLDNNEERHILLPSDTGFYPPGSGKDEVQVDENLEISRQYGLPPNITINLLVPHLGTIKEQEFKEKYENLSKVFYQNHLGIIGACCLILELKPELAVLSEFGEELTSFQGDLIKFIEKIIERSEEQNDAERRIKFLPGDIGFIYDVTAKKVYCQYLNELCSLEDIKYSYRKITKDFIYYSPQAPGFEAADLTDNVKTWLDARKEGKLRCHKPK